MCSQFCFSSFSAVTSQDRLASEGFILSLLIRVPALYSILTQSI